MTQRLWVPRGAAEIFGGLIPRCDDPPTIAIVLEAAAQMTNQSLEKESGDGATTRSE